MLAYIVGRGHVGYAPGCGTSRANLDGDGAPALIWFRFRNTVGCDGIAALIHRLPHDRGRRASPALAAIGPGSRQFDPGATHRLEEGVGRVEIGGNKVKGIG